MDAVRRTIMNFIIVVVVLVVVLIRIIIIHRKNDMPIAGHVVHID